jgi:hypothetical protein
MPSKNSDINDIYSDTAEVLQYLLFDYRERRQIMMNQFQGIYARETIFLNIKESIPPAYVALRSGTTTPFL